MLLLEIENKKSKKLKASQKLLDRLARVLSTTIEARVIAVEQTFTRKLTKNQVYLEILVLYLNNPCDEALFESNKNKEEY